MVAISGGEARRFLLAGAHLLALCAFALAQPLLDLLARTPEFFVVRGSTWGDIVVFALVVLLLPPVFLLALELLARLGGRRAPTVLHLVFVALLSAAVALQVLKRGLEGPGALLVAAALALGAAAALAYARVGAVRTFLTLLALAPCVFLALFLLDSRVSRLAVASSDVELAAAPVARAPAPVVFVVLDELPTSSLMDASGRIDAVRYPSFGALARESTWFRNATTVHEHSTEAVPSLLTGNYPRRLALPSVADHPRNLFTLLARTHRFHVFESITHLCPSELCPREDDPFLERLWWLSSDVGVVYLHVLLPSDLSRRLPPVTQTWMNFVGDGARRDDPAGLDRPIDDMVGREIAEDQKLLFESFVASLDSGLKPTLDFLHVMLPHSPWRYFPSGMRYAEEIAIDGLEIDTWWRDEWLVAQGFQRHLLQTAFVDRLLGRLLDRLRQERLYDRALVVVVADHGVSFRPGERRRGATPANLHDIAFVPLFVKEPGQRRGRVVDEHVQTVDLVPSIADAGGLELRWRVDGRSFFDGRYRGEERVVVHRRAGEAPVVAPVSALLAGRRETVAKQVRLFGSGRAGPGWFGIGPEAPRLVGRPADAFGSASRSGVRAELDAPDLFGDVDPGSGVVPARITGRLEGAGDEPLPLAVAVNGAVEATTRTFELDGETRFAALVPPSAFREGENEVAVYAIRGAGPTVTLEPLG